MHNTGLSRCLQTEAGTDLRAGSGDGAHTMSGGSRDAVDRRIISKEVSTYLSMELHREFRLPYTVIRDG
jgi:hypothetical protein